MKKIIKEVIPYVLIVIVVVLIRTFIVTPVIVVGNSMVPTLKEGQILLLDKFRYTLKDIQRYDIVVLDGEGNEMIKRIIGLPGEVIEYRDNILYVNGHEKKSIYNFETDDFTLYEISSCDKIPQDKYLVLGDNRGISLDSRVIGLIDRKKIRGRVKISLWPIKKVK